MQKTILVFVAIIMSSIVVNAQTWKVDKSHSSITFSVSHLLISEVTGDFKDFDITATTNDKFENPTFDVSIDASTINTNNSMRDEHLTEPDFFDVKKHKNITFKSESFKKLDGNKFELKGKISVNGIVKETVFKGKLNGIIKDPRSGKQKAGLKLTTEIERELFNVGKGMKSIGDTVEVTVRLEMDKQ